MNAAVHRPLKTFASHQDILFLFNLVKNPVDSQTLLSKLSLLMLARLLGLQTNFIIKYRKLNQERVLYKQNNASCKYKCSMPRSNQSINCEL